MWTESVHIALCTIEQCVFRASAADYERIMQALDDRWNSVLHFCRT